MKYGSITQSFVHYILNTTFSTISGASLFPLDAYYSKCFSVLCLILACFIWLDHFTKWQHQCLGVILQVSVSNSCFTEIPWCTRLPKCALPLTNQERGVVLLYESVSRGWQELQWHWTFYERLYSNDLKIKESFWPQLHFIQNVFFVMWLIKCVYFKFHDSNITCQSSAISE